MTRTFDKDYWETHWGSAAGGGLPPHPALDTEIGSSSPGTALDAGTGEGAEALWLAARGWQVTAVDVSAEALRRAASRSPEDVRSVRWIEADLTHWEPETSYDLVTTFYAHPAIPQVEFYRRISRWVAPVGPCSSPATPTAYRGAVKATTRQMPPPLPKRSARCSAMPNGTSASQRSANAASAASL